MFTGKQTMEIVMSVLLYHVDDEVFLPGNRGKGMWRVGFRSI